MSDESTILHMSHGVAIILLFIYGCYLVFQLVSHSHLYDERDDFQSTKYPRKLDSQGNEKPHVSARSKFGQALMRRRPNQLEKVENTEPMTDTALVQSPAANTDVADVENGFPIPMVEEEEEDVQQPQMTLAMSIGLLIVVTVFVAVTAEFLVDSINGVTSGSSGLSTTFVGLILLPIVGNAAEHVTAVSVSVKDKLNLSIGVAVGSSIQIALFVIPFMVVLAWILGKPLSLLFDPFESVTLFLTVITVNYVVADGRSNWLEGMVLMCLYVIIAVAFWFYSPNNLNDALTCS